MVRRTNDFSGFSGRKPEARKKFMALPAFLRKKADFGGDVPDNSPDAQPARGPFHRDVELRQLRPIRRQRNASRRNGQQG